MRNHALKLLPSGLATLLALLTCCGCQPSPEKHRFTLEETVGFAFLGVHYYDAGGAFEPYLDPDAKEVLMKAFAEVQTKYHIGIFGVTGMLGRTHEDLAFVERSMLADAKRITVPHTEQDWLEFYSASVAAEQGILAIAYMARNNVKGAKERLMRMTFPDYWREHQIVEWETWIEDVPYNGLFCAVSYAATIYPEEFADVPELLTDRFQAQGMTLTPEQKKRFRGVVGQFDFRLRRDDRVAWKQLRRGSFRRILLQNFDRYAQGGFAKEARSSPGAQMVLSPDGPV